MTTTIVSPCSGNLNDHDLQALRDYALEAPWEWRKLFDAIVETVESSEAATEEAAESALAAEEKLAEAIADHTEEEETLKRLKTASLLCVAECRKLIREITPSLMNVAVNTGAATKVKSLLDSFTDDFTASIDELEASASEEMTTTEEEEVRKAVSSKLGKKP